MKKIFALTLLFITIPLSATPNGANGSPRDDATNKVLIENYSDLGLLIILRYGEEGTSSGTLSEPLSGKSAYASPKEYTGTKITALLNGLYNIVVQRVKPGTMSPLTNFLGITRDPRMLKTEDGNQEGETIFWNVNLPGNTSVFITLEPSVENTHRIVMARLKTETNNPVITKEVNENA